MGEGNVFSLFTPGGVPRSTLAGGIPILDGEYLPWPGGTYLGQGAPQGRYPPDKVGTPPPPIGQRMEYLIRCGRSHSRKRTFLFFTYLDLGATLIVSERKSFVAWWMSFRLKGRQDDVSPWVDCSQLLSKIVTSFRSLAHAPGPLLTSFRFLKYVHVIVYSKYKKN